MRQRAGTSISSIYSTLVNYMRLHNSAIIRSHPPSQIVPKQTAKCSLLGCQAAGQRPSSSGHKGADAMASSILVSLQKALMDISPQWGSHAAVFISFRVIPQGVRCLMLQEARVCSCIQAAGKGSDCN